MAGTAVFRVDASSAIGGGHAMRCLVLADTLADEGWRCMFASDPETFATVPALACSRHGTCGADESPASADLLVVDHYGLDADYETAARAWARCILVADDLADRPHDCDLLVDQSPGRAAADYVALVPSHARLSIGPAYALLRPQFRARRAEAQARRMQESPLRRVFINFGAVDGKCMTPLALRALARAGIAAEVDVVLGALACSRAETEKLLDALPFPVRVHHAVEDMAALMLAADLGVSAGGTASLERCCLGLPTVAVVTAANQTAQAAALATAGAQVVAGDWNALTLDGLAGRLELLARDSAARSGMARKALAICDGRGAERLVAEMLA